MQSNSAKGKLVNFLILAAILLPLIFIAEVAFVEKQYVKEINQVQNKKLRAEAEVYWLAGQTAYIRGIAKLNAIDTSDPEALPVDLRSFLTADFVALGYAQLDGKVYSDTSGSGVGDISRQNYFAEAAAGREFAGRMTGTDWLLDEEVTVIAVPATVNGTRTGVDYGVIRQATMEAMFANLAPGGISEQQVVGRWLAWLGGVYFLGIIPLLLLVYLLRRPKAVETPTGAVIENQAVAGKKLKISEAKATLAEKTDTLRNESVATPSAENAETIAVRKIAEMIALNSADSASAVGKAPVADKPAATKIIPARKLTEKVAAEMADTTPAAVIDRVMAVAAYKGSRAAAQKEPVILRESQPMAAPELNQDEVAVLSSQDLAAPQQQPVMAQECKATDLSTGDSLTNLYTQSVFEKNIAAQYGNTDSGFVVLSIDGMKVINDFLGHMAGDTIITTVADILKLVIGSDCMAARIDGDKFVALLTGVSTEALEDLKKDIKYNVDLHNIRKPELPLSITTGAAMTKQGESLLAAWERATRDMESRKAVNRVEARKFIMMSIKRYRRKS